MLCDALVWHRNSLVNIIFNKYSLKYRKAECMQKYTKRYSTDWMWHRFNQNNHESKIFLRRYLITFLKRLTFPFQSTGNWKWTKRHMNDWGLFRKRFHYYEGNIVCDIWNLNEFSVTACCLLSRPYNLIYMSWYCTDVWCKFMYRNRIIYCQTV